MISFEQLHRSEQPLPLSNVWNGRKLEKASQKVTNERNFSPFFIES